VCFHFLPRWTVSLFPDQITSRVLSASKVSSNSFPSTFLTSFPLLPLFVFCRVYTLVITCSFDEVGSPLHATPSLSSSLRKVNNWYPIPLTTRHFVIIARFSAVGLFFFGTVRDTSVFSTTSLVPSSPLQTPSSLSLPCTCSVRDCKFFFECFGKK